MYCTIQFTNTPLKSHQIPRTSPEFHNDVDRLHEWIMDHPPFSRVPNEVLSILFQSFRTADRVHQYDTRSNKEPYIGHPIYLVWNMIDKYPNSVDFYDAVALILHDAIEDHPECWRDILTQFGLQTFRDVLILSKISYATREEILEYLVQTGDHDEPITIQILRILSPLDPMDKFQRFSDYREDILGQDSIRFKNALELYKIEIINKDTNREEAHDEYVSLGNYLYFEPKDARRKLRDMLHNMSDMLIMEKKKPGYVEKRRIKAYILGVKLKNFGMLEEYAELQSAFEGTGYAMYTDFEVKHNIVTKK